MSMLRRGQTFESDGLVLTDYWLQAPLDWHAATSTRTAAAGAGTSSSSEDGPPISAEQLHKNNLLLKVKAADRSGLPKIQIYVREVRRKMKPFAADDTTTAHELGSKSDEQHGNKAGPTRATPSEECGTTSSTSAPSTSDTEAQLHPRQCMKALAYLEGGPGYHCPRHITRCGWLHRALDENYVVFLMDQRGSGFSTPIAAPQILHECLDADGNLSYHELPDHDPVLELGREGEGEDITGLAPATTERELQEQEAGPPVSSAISEVSSCSCSRLGVPATTSTSRATFSTSSTGAAPPSSRTASCSSTSSSSSSSTAAAADEHVEGQSEMNLPQGWYYNDRLQRWAFRDEWQVSHVGRRQPLPAIRRTEVASRRKRSPEEQAEFLTHFLAGDIVKDLELFRQLRFGDSQPAEQQLEIGAAGTGRSCTIPRWSLLGQSYGGFIAVRYVADYPQALDRVYVTGGLPPPAQTSPREVYRMTYARLADRNRLYYETFPEDVERVRAIVKYLDENEVRLLTGCGAGAAGAPGRLTGRRFLQLGLCLGTKTGFQSLHALIASAFDGEFRKKFLAGQPSTEKIVPADAPVAAVVSSSPTSGRAKRVVAGHQEDQSKENKLCSAKNSTPDKRRAASSSAEDADVDEEDDAGVPMEYARSARKKRMIADRSAVPSPGSVISSDPSDELLLAGDITNTNTSGTRPRPLSRDPDLRHATLSKAFVASMSVGQPFESQPLYALLQEAIYLSDPKAGASSNWSAASVLAEEFSEEFWYHLAKPKARSNGKRKAAAAEGAVVPNGAGASSADAASLPWQVQDEHVADAVENQQLAGSFPQPAAEVGAAQAFDAAAFAASAPTDGWCADDSACAFDAVERDNHGRESSWEVSSSSSSEEEEEEDPTWSPTRPIYFTSEMVFPWMFEDKDHYPALAPLKDCADRLHARAWTDVSPYDFEKLAEMHTRWKVAASSSCCKISTSSSSATSSSSTSSSSSRITSLRRLPTDALPTTESATPSSSSHGSRSPPSATTKAQSFIASRLQRPRQTQTQKGNKTAMAPVEKRDSTRTPSVDEGATSETLTTPATSESDQTSTTTTAMSTTNATKTKANLDYDHDQHLPLSNKVPAAARPGPGPVPPFSAASSTSSSFANPNLLLPPRCAAVIYENDMYVERVLSEATAAKIPGLRVWRTDAYLHSGLLDDGYNILDRLIKHCEEDPQRPC